MLRCYGFGVKNTTSPITVDFYFNSEYEAKYTEIMKTFFKKGIIKQKNTNLFTTVKP